MVKTNANDTRAHCHSEGTKIARVASAKAKRNQSRSRCTPVGSGRKASAQPRRLAANVPIKKNVMVDSISGAPKMAPTPTSCRTDKSPEAANTATTGIIASGKAVPTAANTDPVTPSEMCNRSPKCSSALVNVSAPTRITINEMNRIHNSIERGFLGETPFVTWCREPCSRRAVALDYRHE